MAQSKRLEVSVSTTQASRLLDFVEWLGKDHRKRQGYLQPPISSSGRCSSTENVSQRIGLRLDVIVREIRRERGKALCLKHGVRSTFNVS